MPATIEIKRNEEAAKAESGAVDKNKLQRARERFARRLAERKETQS